MRRVSSVVLAVSALFAATPAWAEEAAAPTCGRTVQEIADGFILLLYEQGKVREAYEAFVALDYEQHNPTRLTVGTPRSHFRAVLRT